MNGMESLSKLLATPDLPELGPGPRAGVRSEAAVNQSVDEFLRLTKLQADQGQLLRALVLLWHDHLEAAHGIAQNIDNADGAFVHGIMHRREPDYGNAAYWFRRVGRHPVFPELARRVSQLFPDEKQNGLAAELLPRGDWDPFGFITACERIAHRAPSDWAHQLLRHAQGIETELLAAHFAASESSREVLANAFENRSR
jgi:hypothetical protein